MPLQESLERAGYSVTWNQKTVHPDSIPQLADLMILDADTESCSLVVSKWRELDPPPAILLLTHNDAAVQLALSMQVSAVAKATGSTEFLSAVEAAIRARFTAHMSGSFARGLLRLGPATSPLADAKKILVASRTMDLNDVRECLGGKRAQYLSLAALASELLAERTLTVPERAITAKVDGTQTIQRLVSATSGDGTLSGKLIWALLSCGAAICSSEPPDNRSAIRQRILEARKHLRARQRRLEHATHYDVLEVDRNASPKEVDLAARTLALRFSPDRLRDLDLSNLASTVDSNWQQVLLAREVLIDGVDRANYDDWADSQQEHLRSPWAFDISDSEKAKDAFRRGQHALMQGEAFSALSNFASACRAHPDNADYETYLCWAKYRSAAEKADNQLLATCRKTAEESLQGRRPWPQALVALALLCLADKDPTSARYHLEEALSVTPNLPAAKTLLARIP